ncbi:class I SAM-dependent methyltransferase [Denitrobaculum tricleocarpae]|uniref:Class I SAM-dependent methyltransferase n=1 Tax=Denitrobaculum tricleocarpae TaxID=2591009 RepID=A0A545TRG0_9PROT|nr:class I SAM-dependent methyltransferase [Denitrobaculum tricleocarpae]TQV79808.1 class I SAM-dependent methyltransferase [Denitrobaculum tricleocarpae]
MTLFNIARRGFFIPYRYAESLPDAGERASYAAIERLLEQSRPVFAEFLASMAPYADDFARIGADPPPQPRWNQSWFPRLDAAAAYCLVRAHAPKRIIEVGSGHSTRFVARAIADGGLDTQVTAIDPAPRADLGSLPVNLVRKTLHEAGTGLFEQLEAGDFLMIDSSHILMPGSDVDVLFGQVLPALPAGVLVQIHDVFLPDDYPAAWDWRGYNEQLGVLPLLGSGGWEAVFACHFAVSRMAEEVAASAAGGLEMPTEAIESAFWLRKTCDAVG